MADLPTLRLQAVATAPFEVRLVLSYPLTGAPLPKYGRTYALDLYLPGAAEPAISLAGHEWDSEGVVILPPEDDEHVKLRIDQATLAAVPDTTGAPCLSGVLMSTDGAGRPAPIRRIELTLNKDF